MKTVIPRFNSEQEEADWWGAHPQVITELFLKAKKAGKIKRLPAVRGATGIERLDRQYSRTRRRSPS